MLIEHLPRVLCVSFSPEASQRNGGKEDDRQYVLYEIELDGEIVEQRTKVVASRARLLRRVEAWDDELRDAYTSICADRAHELALGATPALADWDAVIEPSVRESPALLGFVAARIAEELSGVEAYHAERRRQSEWLAERLGLGGRL